MKKGDTVLIIAGKEKGKTGIIAQVLREKDKVIVEGLNLLKKHIKPKTSGEKGGVVAIASPIHISNVKLTESKKVEKTVKKVAKKEVKA